MSSHDSPTPPPPPPRRRVPPPSSPPPPASSSLAAPTRPSFWERARSSTVGAIDAAAKGAIFTAKAAQHSEPESDDNPFAPASLRVECSRAARILRTFTLDAADLPAEVSIADRRKSQLVLSRIPQEALAAAQGLVILTVVKKGVIGGGSSGSGVVLARLKDGTWSAPSGILLHTVTADDEPLEKDIYDAVLVLRTDASIAAFSRSRVVLDDELALSDGPLGNGMMLQDGMQDAAVWSYVKSRTLHGGVSLEGRVVLERNEENERSYRVKASASHILRGDVPKPDWADPLFQTAFAAEGLDFEPYSIPQGPSPSECTYEPSRSGDASPAEATADTSAPLLPPRTNLSTSTPSPTRISPAPSFLSYFSRSASAASSHSSQSTATSPVSPGQQRRLPKEDLDDDDLAARREMEEAMRSFGIEDPDVNARSRAEDPLLIVEARPADVEDDVEGDPEAADETATTGRTGTATPDLTTSPGSGLLSDEVEHPPDSPGAPRPRADDHDHDDVEQTPTVAQGETMARQGSRRSVVGDKPPVPPRRTPRIGTTSAVTSPAMAQGEAVVEEKKSDEQVVEEKSEDKSAAVAVEEEHKQARAEGVDSAASVEAATHEQGEAQDEHDGAATVELVDGPVAAGSDVGAQDEPAQQDGEARPEGEQQEESAGDAAQDGQAEERVVADEELKREGEPLDGGEDGGHHQ
ncbi:hypothetical protein JCM8208_006787 [Rhodotorula glutinis]